MKIHIIHILISGLLTETNPAVFESEESAGDYFQKEVTAKGFRKKKKKESWKHYYQAFHEWEETDQRPYDKDDWEIAWWTDTTRK